MLLGMNNKQSTFRTVIDAILAPARLQIASAYCNYINLRKSRTVLAVVNLLIRALSQPREVSSTFKTGRS